MADPEIDLTDDQIQQLLLEAETRLRGPVQTSTPQRYAIPSQ